VNATFSCYYCWCSCWAMRAVHQCTAVRLQLMHCKCNCPRLQVAILRQAAASTCLHAQGHSANDSSVYAREPVLNSCWPVRRGKRHCCNIEHPCACPCSCSICCPCCTLQSAVWYALSHDITAHLLVLWLRFIQQPYTVCCVWLGTAVAACSASKLTAYPWAVL
jgi:hypothetical protein